MPDVKKGFDMSEVFFKVATLEKSESEVPGKAVYKGIVSSTKIDYDNERMSKKAIHALQKDLLKNTSVYFNHRYDGLAVAKTVRTWVQEEGRDAELWAEFEPTNAHGPIDSSGVLVESIVQQLAEGTLKCLSVGGKKVKSYEDDAGVTVLDEVKGLEFSVVGIGANPDAMLKTFAKSAYLDSVGKRFSKGRLESFNNDGMPTERTMREESEEKLEDRMPVVAPVTEAAKDKKKVKQEVKSDQMPAYKTPYEAEYVKGEDMDVVKGKCPSCGHEVEKAAVLDVAKENGPSTPNQPNIMSQKDMEEFKALLTRLLGKMDSGKEGPVSGTTKSVEPEVVKTPTLEERLEKIEKSMVSSPGLAVQEGKFDVVKEAKASDKALNMSVVDEISSRLGIE